MNIKKLRNKLGVTQAQLAKLLKVSERQVRRWEAGEGISGPATVLLKMLDTGQSVPYKKSTV